MAVGAGEQNSPVSRGLARSTAPLERQGRAALEEDPAEESPAPRGEQVERSAGVDARLHHGVYGAQSNTSVSGSSDGPRIQHGCLSLSRYGDRCPTSASYEPSTRRMELARLCRQIHWTKQEDGG